jgi:peptidoglycan hydrolase-like protein with peptidoglycan-binding domain
MARIVTNTGLFLFLVLGCASLNKEEVQAPKAPEPTSAPVSPTPVQTASDRPSPTTTAANAIVSKEEIRMLQARLKAAGFYVGPIDGIVGPKTRSGLFRLQAACANLKDLLESPTSEILLTTGTQATKSQSPKSEDIRLIQVRLKDTGFEPGPIDGLSGAKTRAALLRFEAGCTMLKNWPPTLDNQTADRRISLAGEGKSHPVTAKSIGIESDKMSAGGNQTLNSEKIRQEQLRLRDAGFDPGPIDGILGPKTKAAMQRYQKSLAIKKVTSRYSASQASTWPDLGSKNDR